MSKTKCPSCGSLSIRSGATKCPSCQAWVQPPKFTKRRLRLSPFALACFAAGLGVVGMVAGVGAAVTALKRPSAAPRLSPPMQTSSAASPLPSALAAVSAMSNASAAPENSPAPLVDPPAAEGKFVKTEQVRLDASPLDILYASDESLFFVLCEDGTVRAHDVTSGEEKRRVKLPGRGKSLRRLGAARFAVLGLPELVVIDVAEWRAGKSDPEFLKRITLPNALDVVAVGDPPTYVAIAAQGGKVVRLSSELSGVDAEFVAAPPVRALSTLRVGEAERLMLLVDVRVPTDPMGAVIVLDPAAKTFGASRATWFGMNAPQISASGPDKPILFDATTATVVEFGLDTNRRSAPSGPRPLAAFRWFGDRALVVGAAGEATVVTLQKREVQATLALGGVPSAAVVTPDRRVVLAALGGGLRGKGATTVVLAGEPLAIESTIETGEGSHIVAISPKGGLVAVGASLGRTVTLLARK